MLKPQKLPILLHELKGRKSQPLFQHKIRVLGGALGGYVSSSFLLLLSGEYTQNIVQIVRQMINQRRQI
ncbi:MAG: hypothetical protein A3D92_04015 [Bacteroidetes bacterium RIFCSPHIGHO2_02_FULL_44_7]|nr:MAG: hypothetical protein A3D92_04015 [Bacteroidetes bacterium RIFCSPHIGHO2_02_FULL_44_7]